MAQSSMSTTDPKTESDSSHVKGDIKKPEKDQRFEESDITLTKDNETNNSTKSIHGNQTVQTIPKGRYKTSSTSVDLSSFRVSLLDRCGTISSCFFRIYNGDKRSKHQKGNSRN